MRGLFLAAFERGKITSINYLVSLVDHFHQPQQCASVFQQQHCHLSVFYSIKGQLVFIFSIVVWPPFYTVSGLFPSQLSFYQHHQPLGWRHVMPVAQCDSPSSVVWHPPPPTQPLFSSHVPTRTSQELYLEENERSWGAIRLSWRILKWEFPVDAVLLPSRETLKVKHRIVWWFAAIWHGESCTIDVRKVNGCTTESNCTLPFADIQPPRKKWAMRFYSKVVSLDALWAIVN